MAYNPQSVMNEIYKLKNQWSTANQAGDEKTKTDAAAKAQEYYKQLTDNGYESVANELRTADLSTAKNILNKYASTGKNPTRDYLYSLGKAYDMSEADVDKIIGWNNDTGEISIGGKNIGRPDLAYDGKSYWNDTKVLDSAFKDYVDRSGITPSKSSMVSREDKKLFDKYSELYDNLQKENPFDSETAKAILAKYDLAGLQGRDNAVASGAATNGGNIDSFAAANAMRQQSALVNQGQMAVLEAHQQKIDNVRNILSDLGVHIDRVYNQDETTKNNEVVRNQAISDITGVQPEEYANAQNIYLNKDGTVKDAYLTTEFDNAGGFATIIKDAEARGDTETVRQANEARNRKIEQNLDKYKQYAHTVTASEGKPTFAATQHKDNVDVALNSLMMDSAMNQKKLEADIYKSQLDSQAKGNALAQEREKAAMDAFIKSGGTYEEWENYKNGNIVVYTVPEKYYNTINTGAFGKGEAANDPAEGIPSSIKLKNKAANFIKEYVFPYVQGDGSGELIVSEEKLKEALLTGSDKWGIEESDVIAICSILGVSNDFARKFKNIGTIDGNIQGVEYIANSEDDE